MESKCKSCFNCRGYDDPDVGHFEECIQESNNFGLPDGCYMYEEIYKKEDMI